MKSTKTNDEDVFEVNMKKQMCWLPSPAVGFKSFNNNLWDTIKDNFGSPELNIENPDCDINKKELNPIKLIALCINIVGVIVCCSLLINRATICIEK